MHPPALHFVLIEQNEHPLSEQFRKKKSNLFSFFLCLLWLCSGPVRWEQANLTEITPSAYENVNKTWLTPLPPSRCAERNVECVDVTATQSAGMGDRVCGWMCQSSGGETEGWRVAAAAAAADGWMNVNISLTLPSQRLGWFICLRCLCHSACLMCTPTTPTDGALSAPACLRLSLRGVAWPSLEMLLPLCVWVPESLRWALMCICQHEWTSSFFFNCVLHRDKWCFSKTSAEKQVQKCGSMLLVSTTNGSSLQAGTF